MLKESGLSGPVTTVGIQSANTYIRTKILNRNVTDERIVRFANILHKNNIIIRYDIVGWNPFEDNTTLYEGLNLLRKLPKGQLTNVFTLKIFPGSRLAELYDKLKPRSLSDQEYEYWAWIYQMILRSKETESLADFVLQYDYFKKNPRILKHLFDECLSRDYKGIKLYAKKDIPKGMSVTTRMLEYHYNEDKQGIKYPDDLPKISDRIAARDIQQGEMLVWDDFYSSYENVGKGDR